MSTKKKPTSVPMEIVNTCRAKLVLPDGTVLLPGANRVSDAVIKRCRAVDITRTWLARGLIQIREQAPQAGSLEYDLSWGLPQSLAGLSLETIRQAVQQCGSKDQLFDWLKSAGDPEVRQLIVDRGYALTVEALAAEATAQEAAN
jgi:hypothetical protein